LKTGIKTSSPSSISPAGALNNILFFAINQPRVEIVLKKSINAYNSFSLNGFKAYDSDFINGALDYLYTLDVFKASSFVNIEILNRIPFGIGLGAHSSLFACLYKAVCVFNNRSFNNRELYNLLLSSDNSFLKRLNTGRILTSLDGGCLFVDQNNPELYHRVYLPGGITWIIYRSSHYISQKQIASSVSTKDDLTKSIAFLIGLHSSKWELIKHGFWITQQNLSSLEISPEDKLLLLENALGINYNIQTGLFLLCFNNSLKAETCKKILTTDFTTKIKGQKILMDSAADLIGTIKM